MEQPTMTLGTALSILTQVCGSAQGNLQFHNDVQMALGTVNETLGGMSNRIQALVAQVGELTAEKKPTEAIGTAGGKKEAKAKKPTQLAAIEEAGAAPHPSEN